jgi:hypothetical protein
MTTLFLPELGLDGRGLGKARPPTARFPAQLSARRDRGLHGSRLSFPSREDGVSFLPRMARKATTRSQRSSSADGRRGERGSDPEAGGVLVSVRSQPGTQPTHNPDRHTGIAGAPQDLRIVGSPHRVAGAVNDPVEELVLRADEPSGHLQGQIDDLLLTGCNAATQRHRPSDGLGEPPDGLDGRALSRFKRRKRLFSELPGPIDRRRAPVLGNRRGATTRRRLARWRRHRPADPLAPAGVDRRDPRRGRRLRRLRPQPDGRPTQPRRRRRPVGWHRPGIARRRGPVRGRRGLGAERRPRGRPACTLRRSPGVPTGMSHGRFIPNR